MPSNRKHAAWTAGYNRGDDRVGVEYLGRLQLAVSGTFTGTLYRFSPMHPVQHVDLRDAFYLLSSGLFGVAS
jgi:hypothetical protein